MIDHHCSRVQFLAPVDRLADRVHAIVLRRPDSAAPTCPAEQRFAANPFGALSIIHQGLVVDPDRGQPLAPLEFSGPRMQPVRRQYVGDPVITTVLFKPGVLQAWLGLPASALLNTRLNAGPWLNEEDQQFLLHGLLDRPSAAQQVVAFETFLERLLGASSHAELAPPQESDARVEQWAERLGCSARHLHRLCISAVGLTPKEVLRLERLRRSLDLLAHANADQPLTDLAADAGFTDAAHLARDMRALTGLSPSELRKAVTCSERCALSYTAPDLNP